jgi:uncharacterized protein
MSKKSLPVSTLPTPRTESKKEVRHEDLRPGESLCNHCTALCCRYFALEIDKPTCRKDFDYIRWYLLHEQTAIFTEQGAWYLLVNTPCKHLRADHRCGIYETRPKICRDYSTVGCERDDYVYENFWETPEQIEEYADRVFGLRKKK